LNRTLVLGGLLFALCGLRFRTPVEGQCSTLIDK